MKGHFRKSPKDWKTYSDEELDLFLIESNAIEGVYGEGPHKAAKKAFKYLANFSHLTTRQVLRAHAILLKDIDPEIAGWWRRCDVWIGGEKKEFQSVEIIENKVTECLLRIHDTFGRKYQDNDKVQLAILHHVMFEDIHPFRDGNGRVGRMIYNWHRLRLGLPLHIIKAGWEQQEYYKWFRRGKERTVEPEFPSVFM